MSIYVYIYKCLSIQLDQKMHFQHSSVRLQVRTEYYSLTLNFLQFLLRSTFLSVFHN